MGAAGTTFKNAACGQAAPGLRKRNNRRASFIRVDIKCKRDTLAIQGRPNMFGTKAEV
jgi:hypothetical protein